MEAYLDIMACNDTWWCIEPKKKKERKISEWFWECESEGQDSQCDMMEAELHWLLASLRSRTQELQRNEAPPLAKTFAPTFYYRGYSIKSHE